MPRLIRRSLGCAAFILALLLCLIAFRSLAALLVGAHLQHVAAERESALRAGRPLWSWPLRHADDLVAGRVFGAAVVASDGDGVKFHSMTDAPFEVGLPLSQPVDPTFWPELRLQGDFPPGSRVAAVVRDVKSGLSCQSDLSAPLSARTGQLTLGLDALPARQADGSSCSLLRPLAMLRLRIQMTAGTDWHLREAALVRANVARLPEKTYLRLPAPPIAGLARIKAAEAATGGSPLIKLDEASTSETMLALRDAIYQRWPGAIVQVGDHPPALVPAIAPVYAWLFLMAYFLALTLQGWQRHARRSAAALCLVGPLWLITGQQLPAQNGPIHWPPTLAFIAALIFAGMLEWRDRPTCWHATGPARAWLAAIAPLPLGLLLITWRGHPLTAPPLHHIAAYLAWAALQQWLLLAVLLLRLERLPRAAAILLCAILFALLHTPNGLLMQLCFVAELWWAGCFLRHRALLPIALAHAASALLLEAGLAGGGWLRSLEVSARFVS